MVRIMQRASGVAEEANSTERFKMSFSSLENIQTKHTFYQQNTLLLNALLNKVLYFSLAAQSFYRPTEQRKKQIGQFLFHDNLKNLHEHARICSKKHMA